MRKALNDRKNMELIGQAYCRSSHLPLSVKETSGNVLYNDKQLYEHGRKTIREFPIQSKRLPGSVGAAWLGMTCGFGLFSGCSPKTQTAETFIGKATSYNIDIATLIRAGFRELKVNEAEIQGKRILLKPNMVEPPRGPIIS